MIDFSTTKTVKLSLKFLLTLGQYLGYFPTFHSNFRWKSWKVIHAVFVISSLAVCNFLTVCWALKQTPKVSLEISDGLCTTAVITFNSILLFRLAMKWADIIKQWCHIDAAMNKIYGHPRHVKMIIVTLTIIFLLLAIIVFIMKHVSEFSKISLENEHVSLDEYFKKYYSAIFWTLPYHRGLVLFLLVMQLEVFLMPVYTDVLLIALSIILTCRFQQITNTLKQNQSPQFDKSRENFSFWKNMRRDYCILSSLVFTVDDNISWLIIYSYGVNFLLLLHFLTNFLRGFEVNRTVKIYNYLNALSFLTRMFCLTFFSSWINEQSQEPVNVLNSVAPENYNAEVGRLLLQLSFDEVALTGCKMFKLNKKLLLSVVSGLVTYELMIIQYNNSYVKTTDTALDNNGTELYMKLSDDGKVRV